MPKNAKGAKSTKKKRTKIGALPVSETGLSQKEKKSVKGGIGLLTPALTAATPSVTVGGGIGPSAAKETLDPELLLTKKG